MEDTVRVKLQGGYANEVYLISSLSQTLRYIEKSFLDTPLSIANAYSRCTRERIALQYYSPFGIAPTFLGGTNSTLKQEYIDGESLEAKFATTQDRAAMLYKVGALLRVIHQPVNRPVHYLRQSFEKRARQSATTSQALLEILGLSNIPFTVDWQEVYQFGTRRIHGDFHLGNIIEGQHGTKIIDWEYARPASPFQEFALAELNIFYKHGQQLREAFWAGYGSRPQQKTINEYIKWQCLRYLGSISLEHFQQETLDGFYHSHANILKNFISSGHW